MRADARRNQQRILAAARTQITEHGSDVSMGQIAKAAGVAVGTLYRHYPTKTDLVRAVLTEFLEALVVWAEASAASLRAPGDAMVRIETLLTDFMNEAALNQAVKEAAHALGAVDIASEQADRGQVALRALVASAQADDDLRLNITADDLYLMMISAPTNLEKSARDRWLHILVDGIRQP
ncbi:TetR/AcrR family transcriptional regulator [Agreia sp.]|uniref:TetR/AcrR family transcriptional regulator n=1 Tax=Agreia sp. TaxID=1872416 RepID=UPI0035BBD9E0